MDSVDHFWIRRSCRTFYTKEIKRNAIDFRILWTKETIFIYSIIYSTKSTAHYLLA